MVERLILCETIPAITIHLRQLTAAGPKYGGGADTKALCGAPVSWDLPNSNIEIARCRRCRELAGMHLGIESGGGRSRAVDRFAKLLTT